MGTAIKICGITSLEEMKWLAEEAVEYAGIVLFFEESRRCCSLQRAEWIVSETKKICNPPKLVAVCVSPTKEQVAIIEEIGFDYLQIHGTLSDEVVHLANLPIIRAVGYLEERETVLEVSGKVIGTLYDSACPGSGVAYDWGTLTVPQESEKLFFLAGGLTPENVKHAIEVLHPDVVDVSSGVERAGSVGKDKEKILDFISEVRGVENGRKGKTNES